MPRIAPIILLSSLALATGAGAFAQRGGGHEGGAHARSGGPTLLPSSTALGAGALSLGPSSTAASTLPTLGFSNGRGGYAYARGGYAYGRGGYGFRGDYRRVPPAFFLAPYYYPFLDYSEAPYGAAPSDYNYDPGVQASMMAESALGQQLQNLTAQVQQLEAQNNQPHFAYAPPEQPQPPSAPVTLVLRDGEQLQVQNYAVMNQTFWDFSTRPVRKIPFSEINVPASVSKTEASGGEFPPLQ